MAALIGTFFNKINNELKENRLNLVWAIRRRQHIKRKCEMETENDVDIEHLFEPKFSRLNSYRIINNNDTKYVLCDALLFLLNNRLPVFYLFRFYNINHILFGCNVK